MPGKFHREIIDLPSLLAEGIHITPAGIALENAKVYALAELWDDKLTGAQNAKVVNEYLAPFRVAAGLKKVGL